MWQLATANSYLYTHMYMCELATTNRMLCDTYMHIYIDTYIYVAISNGQQLQEHTYRHTCMCGN